MNFYTATVVTQDGKKSQISDRAISKALFEESLAQRGFYIVDIKELKDLQGNSFFSEKIRKDFLLDFTYNVYSLLDFGLDINEVFRILKDVYSKGEEALFIDSVNSSLTKGEDLYSSIKNTKTGQTFNSFILSMIKAGEQSGKLTHAFKLINKFLKSSQKLKEKIIASSIYPIMLLFFMFVAVNLLFLFILPTFKQIFMNLDFPPSLFIRIMLSISDVLSGNVLAYFLILFFVTIGLIVYLKSSLSRPFIQFMGRKFPVVSKINLYRLKIKIAFSMEILLKGGASIEEALIKISESETDTLLKKQFERGIMTLKNGGSVKQAFDHIKIFNQRDLHIIEISEAISRSTEGFEKIHIDTDNTLEMYIDKIMKLIEPALLVVISLFIVVIMYLVMSPTLEIINKY